MLYILLLLYLIIILFHISDQGGGEKLNLMVFINWIFFHAILECYRERLSSKNFVQYIKFYHFVFFIYIEGDIYIFNGKTPKEMPPISLYTVNLYQSFSVSIYISRGIQNSSSPKE